MHLHTLVLHQFRCHKEIVLTFEPRINRIVGDNAAGKTTILEAIHLLMTGGSFRPSQLADMVKSGSEAFRIESYFVKHGVEQRLVLLFDGKTRHILYNNTQIPSASHLLGLIQGVTIHPDDVQLIKGAPQVRRQFLDLQLALADPLYVHHLQRYYRGMRQRNSLLKLKQTATLSTWEQEMAHSAAYLLLKRSNAVSQLQERAAKFYSSISSESAFLQLKYKAAVPFSGGVQEEVALHLQQQYMRTRRRELELGITLNGPHKDDILVNLGGQEAKTFASEGQKRTCALALKLAEWELLRDSTDVVPLIQVDDIGVSLDQRRQSALYNHLEEFKQVVVTSTKEAYSFKNAAWILIEK